MSLKDDLIGKGWLLEFPAGLRKERVNGHLSRAFGDLAYAEKGGWDPRFPFRHAFDAIDNLANAALIATGYRVVFEGHNYAIRTLALTINASSDMIDRLEYFRGKHDKRFDEQASVVTEQEAKEIFSLAQTLNKTVRAWIKSTHPELCTEFT